MKYVESEIEMREVVVPKSAAMREKAGRYMSMAKGVTTLRRPSMDDDPRMFVT